MCPKIWCKFFEKVLTNELFFDKINIVVLNIRRKCMKNNKVAVSMITVIMFLILVGCEQNKMPKIEEISGNIPDWVSDTLPEDILYGIGVGDLSTINASCEQAKFNAQADICRQVSMYIMFAEETFDSLKTLYQNEFYNLLSINASDQVSFELSEFIKIDKRTRDVDGKIWYRVSLLKKDAKIITNIISQYQKSYFESYIKGVEEESQSRVEDALRRMDEAFNKLQ